MMPITPKVNKIWPAHQADAIYIRPKDNRLPALGLDEVAIRMLS